jgi:ATP-dependent DNA helicase PIF1
LKWIRHNQDKLRVELYGDVANTAANDLRDIGMPTVLPSSFIGSPRHMGQLFHDSMAVIRVHSQPDLFITMTCNPLWPEIRDALLSGQTAQDRPDSVARVFKLKLTALLKDVTDKQIFGKVIAHMHVIEFQKQGLPHAHILLILDHEFKPRTPEIVNSIIQAEIPNRETHPLLYETVIRCMFHGPWWSWTSQFTMHEGRKMHPLVSESLQ